MRPKEIRIIEQHSLPYGIIDDDRHTHSLYFFSRISAKVKEYATL